MAGLTIPLDAPATAYPMASTPTPPQADFLGGLGRFSRVLGGAVAHVATAPAAIAQHFVAPALGDFLSGLTGGAPVATAAPAAAPAPAPTVKAAPAAKMVTPPTGVGAAAPPKAASVFKGLPVDMAVNLFNALARSQTEIPTGPVAAGRAMYGMALQDALDAQKLPGNTPEALAARQDAVLKARQRLESLGLGAGLFTNALGQQALQSQQVPE